MKPLVYKKAKRVRHQAPVRMRLHITKGDTVQVISGDDKGKRGRVLRVHPKTGRVTIEGVNIVKRHRRATPDDRGRDRRVPGADPSFEGDAARPQERRAHPGPAPQGRRRHGGADRREVGSVDSEEPVTMAETTEKAPKAPKGGARKKGDRRAPPRGKGKDKAPAGAVDHAPKAAEGTPRLQEYYEKTVRAKIQKDFGLAQPAPGAAGREGRAQHRHGRRGQEPEAARGRGRGAGADHRPACGRHPGQEGDRQLRAPGRHAGRLPR